MADGTSAAQLLTTARRALAEWEFDVDDIELVSRSENTVFRFVAGANAYALRIHRPGYNSLDELNSELLWTEALREAGIDTPGHVLTRDGRGYAAVPLEGTGQIHYAGVIEWLEGTILAQQIEQADPDEATGYFEQLGEIMARIHNQSAGWTIPQQFTRRSWDADGLAGDSPLWGRFWLAPQLSADESELLLRTKTAIHETLTAFGASPNTYSMTHADLHPQNLLVDAGRLQAIDFDDSGFGWHHYEFAVALNQYRLEPRFPEIRDAVFNGYSRLRALDPTIAEMLPTFLLIRSLVILGWIVDRPELGHGERLPLHIAQTCQRAREFLEHH